MIELRTGEVIAEVVGKDVPRRAFKPSEVATQLGVSERYVYTLIETGELKSVPLAGRKQVLAEDLDAFIEVLKAEREKALRGAS
jgi:excisionase family DNA binding protein